MLYIADTGNGAIRRVLLDGQRPKVVTVACEENVAQCAKYTSTCFGGGSTLTCGACDPGFYLDIMNNTCTVSNPLPTGTNVTQEFTNERGEVVATLKFSNVSGAGYTSIMKLDNVTSLAPFPAGFQISGVVYDIQTTAVSGNGGDAEVCLLFPDGADPQDDRSTPIMLHYHDGAWVDITTSYNAGTGLLCGYTTHFSPFVVGLDTSSDMKVRILIVEYEAFRIYVPP